MHDAYRQTARAAALRLLAALALRLREERGAPALLPYLPAMMLPLVRLDEQSHGGAAADSVLPAHLAEVCLLLLASFTCIVLQGRGLHHSRGDCLHPEGHAVSQDNKNLPLSIKGRGKLSALTRLS